MVPIGGCWIKGLEELAKYAGKLKKSFAISTLRTALRGAGRPVVKLAKVLRQRLSHTHRAVCSGGFEERPKFLRSRFVENSRHLV